MIVYKSGDILNATENIICHQVNVDGIMGGGLAKQIASAYPEVEKLYSNFCEYMDNDYEKLKGTAYEIEVENKYTIANCFTQKPNFDTDYKALKKCFKNLLYMCKEKNLSICVPYMMGCGIANGKWEKVETILRKLSRKYDVDINIYKLVG